MNEMIRSFRASPVFVIALLIALGSAALMGLLVVLMNVAPELLPPPFNQMEHGTDPAHRVHDATFGLLFGVAVVGMLAQLRRPTKNVAGLLMALTPWVGLLLAGVLSDAFASVVLRNPARSVAPLVLIAALLHPSGRDFFRSFSVRRVEPVMLALVVMAAVPLLAYAATSLRLQATVTDSHSAMGHYGFMAGFGFTIVGAGLLASLRPDGWKLAAFVAGILPVLLGIVSMLVPGASSGLSSAWAFAAIAWGIGFVVAANHAENPALAAPLEAGTVVSPAGEWRTKIRPWQIALGGIALAVALLSIVPFILGVGGHGPGRGPGGHGGGPAPIDGLPELAIAAGALTFEPDHAQLRSDEPVNVVLASNDMTHDLVFDEVGFSLAAGPSETAAGALVFHEPGTYVGYCSVPGHREAGMEIEVVVTGGGHDPAYWRQRH